MLAALFNVYIAVMQTFDADFGHFIFIYSYHCFDATRCIIWLAEQTYAYQFPSLKLVTTTL